MKGIIVAKGVGYHCLCDLFVQILFFFIKEVSTLILFREQRQSQIGFIGHLSKLSALLNHKYF